MFETLFGFKGRLSRDGYLESLLGIALAGVAAVIIAEVVGEYGLPGGYFEEHPVAPQVSQAIPVLAAILMIWAIVATTVKRCHDRNRSGWLALIALIPAIGWLWLLVDLFILKGTRGQNRFGPEPHGEPAVEPIGWQGEFITADSAPEKGHAEDNPVLAPDHAPASPAPEMETHEEADFPETQASGYEAADPDAPSAHDAADTQHDQTATERAHA